MLQYIGVNYLYHQRTIEHHVNLKKRDLQLERSNMISWGKVALKLGKF